MPTPLRLAILRTLATCQHVDPAIPATVVSTARSLGLRLTAEEQTAAVEEIRALLGTAPTRHDARRALAAA